MSEQISDKLLTAWGNATSGLDRMVDSLRQLAEQFEATRAAHQASVDWVATLEKRIEALESQLAATDNEMR